MKLVWLVYPASSPFELIRYPLAGGDRGIRVRMARFALAAHFNVCNAMYWSTANPSLVEKPNADSRQSQRHRTKRLVRILGQ